MPERQYESNTQDVSFNSSDFAEDLDFGVEDAKTIGKSQLDSFLNSDPSSNVDTTKITKVEDEQNEKNNDNTKSDSEVNLQKNSNSTKIKSSDEDKTREKEAEEARKVNALNSWLSSDNEEDDSDDSSNTKTDKTQNVSKEKQNTKDTSSKKEEDISDDNEEDNTFSILSRDLLKLGVFTRDEDEEDLDIKTAEQFLERFNEEKARQANDVLEQFLDRHGEEYRRMFESVFIKGVHPKDYLASYSKIESFKDLDLSKPDTQEKIFFQYYRDQGLSEERISKRFEKVKDLGDLSDEVKDMHDILLAKEEKNIVKLEQERQEELKRKTQRDNFYLQNIGSILQAKLKAGDFDGIPLTQKEVQEVYSYMTNKPYRLPNGELITEMHKDWLELDRPENHEIKVKAALLMKNKLDLSKVVKKAISKNSNTLFSDLTSKKKTSRTEDKSNITPKSFFE